MRRRAHRNVLISLTLLLIIFGPATAHAACFYPDKDLSGYRIPLEVETRTTPFIVIGTVTSQLGLREDASDPEGISAWIYTFRVSRRLKGRVPDIIKLRTENDSGGFRMSVGERQLLFLRPSGEYFHADACGNASTLPGGNATVGNVERLLARRAAKTP